MTAELNDASNIRSLAAFIAGAIGATRVEITAADRLPGGAVQENWKLAANVTGSPHDGVCTWVLRTDSAVRLPIGIDRISEARVLRAAAAAGVRVAEPIAAGQPGDVAEGPLQTRPFLLQQCLEGSAVARRLVRDPAVASWGPAVAAELAAELARIHTITPSSETSPEAALTSLPVPMLPPARAEVARLRAALEKAGDVRPALEYILAWLDERAPPARAIHLVHGDFRTGNYLVHDGRLAGVLDWEFAHWGDPDEDLGWFTARCWRFGADDREAGGIAPLAPFLEAYEKASGRKVMSDALRYWRIMAAAKWAAIAVLQGDRVRKGGERSLELALTATMPAAMEHDALADVVAWTEHTDGKGGPKWQA